MNLRYAEFRKRGSNMKQPKMIIFDYGQTLVDEKSFDAYKGTEAVLREAVRNPNQVTAAEIQALANELNKDIGRYGPDFEKQMLIEVHIYMFQNYLYEYFGIELKKAPAEVERIFWQAASAAAPTPNIAGFLKFLDEKDVRTSVISNISFSGRMLTERINQFLPSHKFEFIIASSEYVFRKPHRRIFELALRKANLEPAEVWYCGDNAVCDVDGAAACGIVPVWYKGAIHPENQYIPKSNCLTVNDWNELVEMLMGD